MALNYSALLWVLGMLAAHTAATTYWTTTHFNNSRVLSKLLMHDIVNCLVAGRHYSHSIVDMSKNIRQCFRKHLYHCVKSKIHKNTNDVKNHVVLFDKNIHCGKVVLHPMAVVSRGLENDLRIRNTKGYIIHVNMLLFDFEWCSLGCRSHGMGISDSAGDKTVWFCGRRIPWTIVLRGDEVQIHIQVVHGKYKNAMFFYSKLKTNWVKYYTAHIHNHPAIQQSWYNFRDNSHVGVYHIRYYNIYIIALPMQVIHLYSSALTSDVDLAFYDGPGLLSKKMFSRYYNGVTTSAFRAFVSVGIHVSENITLKIQAKERRVGEALNGCIVNSYDLRVHAWSTLNAGMICYTEILIRGTALKLFLRRFDFVGPSMLDSSGDLDDCQYGGLFLNIQQKTVAICDYKYEHVIFNDEPSLILMLLWYKGYSAGYIEGELYAESCVTTYLDLKPSLSTINQIMMRPEDMCRRVLCPSLNYNGQACHITFNVTDRAIGVADVGMHAYSTLYACVGLSDYYNKTYRISALSSREWPFSRIEQYNISKAIHQGQTEFIYLSLLNISIPYVCQRENTLHQLGVVLHRTSCVVNEFKRPIYGKVRIGNVTMFEMTKECISISYPVKPDETTYLIYFARKTRHTGVNILFDYNIQCPKGCSNNMYVLKVWDKLNNETRLYNSSISSSLMFTGYFYDSFIVQIIPPANPCHSVSGCSLGVYIFPPLYPIGTLNSTSFQNGKQKMKMYQKR